MNICQEETKPLGQNKMRTESSNEIKPFNIQQFTKTKVFPSQVLFNINILHVLSNIRVFTEIK